jgi:hypothetical protein
MGERAAVTHYVADDWGPLCRCAIEFDEMWAFIAERVTCPDCRRLLKGELGEMKP